MGKTFKGFAIVSEDGIMYDATGNSMAVAVYSLKKDISPERRAVMIEGDKIVPCIVTY